MSDWSCEMLRYAFSWNEESAERALKYVVNSRSSTESMSEFQLLDILLLTILTEKDEVERTCALVFLEEHGCNLVHDYTRLHKVYFVLDNILGSPVDGQSMTYSLKSQVLVTYTALLIQFDCFGKDPARFEGFVDLLYSTVKHTNKSADRIFRAYACECLHELETWYPGLLFPLLGEDWSVTALNVPNMCHVGQSTLGKFVQDELLHVHENYSRLFFTTFQHFTEQVVQEAMKYQPTEEGYDALSIAPTPHVTPPSSCANTPPSTPRGPQELSMAALRGGLAKAGGNGKAAGAAGMPSYASRAANETFSFRIPRYCHSGPEVAYDLRPNQTPPRLPRKLVRTMTRSISLVLETMPTASSWTKIFFAERLSLFIRVLALPCRVVFHHFSPLLYALRPSLFHAFLVVTTLFSKEIDPSVSEAVVDRLFTLTQDTAIETCFRVLAINWHIALSASKTSQYDLFWNRVDELCPRWYDPLELKEMKLQALIYCFRISQKLPTNLLVVLEALSEFKYCCRPVGAHAVVFRFLLRIVIDFAPDMDRLGVPQCLCDMLRSHPHLLPSVLCVERYANSDVVQYKLMHSLGDCVARLEPPSRLQCYFGLLVTLSQTSWLDPGYVMTALKRLVFCPTSTLTWQVGMRVLITCRRIILSHPQAVIYQPMIRLLYHLVTYQSCVDLRDRALLYLGLLTHTGSATLGTLFHPNNQDIGQMSQLLTPILPKTFRLINGPVPFLRFYKSLDERRRLGILDKKCTVFVLPAGIADRTHAGGAGADDPDRSSDFDSKDWELRWCDSGDDHQIPREWFELADQIGHHDLSTTGREQLSAVLRAYRERASQSPPSIRLPFVLQYEKIQKMTSEALDWLDPPLQLFCIELTFSSSEHFVPIEPIRIPFITAEDAPDAGSNTGGFPRIYKLLLKLQPISPVPTSFGVNIAFDDSLGHMYFGQLEEFNVAFQDLFLPVRLPLAFWPRLFESLWKGNLEESCWSVKVLNLDRAVVKVLIRTLLGPFIVKFKVEIEEEDFDFEQEEYFERSIPTDMVAEEIEMPDDVDVKDIVLNVETTCVIVFIPPCYHLLMRFTISSHSTIVRIVTDRFQLLSYMDVFFSKWCQALKDEIAGDDAGGAAPMEEAAGPELDVRPD